eukprot:TRINITY_DN30728_c0_g1_i4.p1 TRINITY_DN30728_c0_g1~~TRINITY_DN30728_c0_g1_i4.p1  ORF type:complete len:109 (+),score=20.37 TRINITY_DN30728_c0_g1_i4:51-377(+)
MLSSFFFFFKQKTAYEMLRSLVGSEMCIRDSPRGEACVGGRHQRAVHRNDPSRQHHPPPHDPHGEQRLVCPARGRIQGTLLRQAQTTQGQDPIVTMIPMCHHTHVSSY